MILNYIKVDREMFAILTVGIFFKYLELCKYLRLVQIQLYADINLNSAVLTT